MLIYLALVLFYIPLIIIAFLMYASGLTWKTAEVERLLGPHRRNNRTQAAVVLGLLESPAHEKLAEFGYARHFVRKMLPFVFREALRYTRLGGDLTSLLLFAVFCLVYGLVWCKARIRPDKEDLRGLIGAEMLILRRAEGES